MGRRPLPCHRQTGASVEEAALTAVGLPLPRGFSELAVNPQTGPVRIDPPAELGPTPDQGLVSHLDVTLLVTAISFLRRPPLASGGDQPGIRQPPDDCLDRRHLTHGVEQLSEWRAPLGVFGPLARLRQP